MITTIDLIRHGEVAGKPALYGETDVPLSDNGLQQMMSQVPHVSGAERLISSPLQRCRKGAVALSEALTAPLSLLSGIAECRFGDVDGLPFDDAGDKWPAMEAFWQQPVACPLPGGEPLAEFHQRVMDAWHTLLHDVKGQHCLVVTHGGVIRQIIARLLNIDWQQASVYQHLTIGYGSLTRITIGDYADALPAIQFIGVPPPAVNGADR
ncbi:alpha-ribazole phosphatase family protein [Alteromonas sp. RKMC-009]|uniref:alpha-ribazole phosphatase family protein n=1 Tax=Alteromonas sp. RKMC-009 TaxID=2267264 RepID=UPI000E6A8534|nr:alpha-ribazole phosphatase family protein [Alteromonas sp. RKMC-009]AYA63239.1 histidine phosphatase [Alteromonas sp. RKMC-009]